MERVARIGGLFLRADDPARLGRWYADHLGVDAAPEPAEPSPGLSMFTAMPAGGTATSFEVSDLDAMVAQLRGAGIDVDVDLEGHRGGRFASLRDPEGNLVQLWQPTGAWSAAPGYVQPLAEHPASEPPAHRRVARRLPLAMGALIVAVFVVVANQESDPAETTESRPAVTTTTTKAAVTPPPMPTKPFVVDTDPRLLGVTDDWELFAHGPDELIRIELARGRVTRTPLPKLDSSGPAAFIVGSDRVLIRPMDHVTGYVIPDRQPARALTGKLSTGSLVFPGPEQDQVWLETAATEDRQVLSLVTLDGANTGQSVALPAGLWPHATDGRGNLIGSGIGGTYLVGPDGPRRITTGAVTAVGPTHFLTLECDGRARCADIVIDRRTGVRRALDVAGSVDEHYFGPGVISPDGAHAALARPGRDGQLQLQLLDLDTAARRTLDVVLNPESEGEPHFVWSPDSRWLFVPSEGQLVAVEAVTRRTKELGVSLPSVTGVAVRSR